MTHIDLTSDQPILTVRNPALLPLEELIGDWDVEISNAEWLPEQAGGARASVTGLMTLAWLEPAFITMGSHVAGGPPDSLAIIGRNEALDDYTLLYYDERGVSRVYGMTYDGHTWTLWRSDPGFLQRFTASVSEDVRTITGVWEKSHERGIWEHDFDVVYRRR